MPTETIVHHRSPDQRLLSLWQRLNGIPLGKPAFNFLVARIVPYTGSVKPKVCQLEPGFARVELKERRKIQNHLNSVHAIALANLGEFASGLAMLAALPDSAKAIVVHLEIEYIKKARGALSAEGKAEPPQQLEKDEESIAYATIRDADNDIVAKMAVTWRLRPKQVEEAKVES